MIYLNSYTYKFFYVILNTFNTKCLPLIILINLNNTSHKREYSSKRYFEIFWI